MNARARWALGVALLGVAGALWWRKRHGTLPGFDGPLIAGLGLRPLLPTHESQQDYDYPENADLVIGDVTVERSAYRYPTAKPVAELAQERAAGGLASPVFGVVQLRG